jgi:hypothetical protein
MQALQLSPEDRKLLFSVNKNLEWLKLQLIKNQAPEQWGTYEDACKILNRSKSWYKNQRLGVIKSGLLTPATLEKGKDWREVGNRTEFRIAAIHELKDRMSKKD